MTTALSHNDADSDANRRSLRAVQGAGVIDASAVEQAVADLLQALGRDESAPHLSDTPRRVAATFVEMLTPAPFLMTTFPNEERYDELVVARGIPFSSLCAHHLLAFSGVAHVGYLPGERILGLSKLARVVRHFAADLQIQERLTTQIADFLQSELSPKGVGVVLEAEHSCMSVRGVQTLGTCTITSRLLGRLREDPRSRQEFLSLVGARP